MRWFSRSWQSQSSDFRSRVHPSPYMTTAEAAAYLRAKPQRVHDLLSAGQLTRFKDGGRTLVLRAEVESLVAGTQR